MGSWSGKQHGARGRPQSFDNRRPFCNVDLHAPNVRSRFAMRPRVPFTLGLRKKLGIRQGRGRANVHNQKPCKIHDTPRVTELRYCSEPILQLKKLPMSRQSSNAARCRTPHRRQPKTVSAEPSDEENRRGVRLSLAAAVLRPLHRGFRALACSTD
jgi:hypothetical protein